MPSEPPLEGKTLLVVHTGSEKKRFVFQKLKKLGLTVVVLNKEKNWAAPYVDHWILADPNQYNEAIQRVAYYLYRGDGPKPDGVFTFWEESVLCASKLVDRFNWIGIPYAIAERARNKFLFREFCHQNGLPAPRHQLLKSEGDIDTAVKNLTFPLVTKPIFGSASAFVVKVEDEQELRDTYKYIRANIMTHADASEWDQLDILVEEYIDGEEVDIDIILQNGKVKYHAISDNFSTREPYFIETGHSIPSNLPEEDQLTLMEMAEETLEKLGVQNGIIHLEAKSTKTGPVPIEVNLRMGGDEVYSFNKQCWRVDLVESAAKIALGVHIPKYRLPETPFKYLAERDFLSETSGVLVNIDIPENLEKLPYVHELLFNKEIGDVVLSPPQGYENLGWVTVNGNNHLDALDNLETVFKQISYEVVKFGPESNVGRTLRPSPSASATLQKNLIIGAAKIEKIRRMEHKDQHHLHVGVACNLYENGEGILEKDITRTARDIEAELKKREYKVTMIDFNNLPLAFNMLRQKNIDLVVNVCQQINNSRLLEPHAAAILDALQIPYTGSNPFTLGLCADKIRVKKLLAYHNIPTPAWDYAYSMDDSIDEELEYPLIVKPSNTDGSIGLSNDSVVTNEKELKIQLEKIIIGMGRPALVEEYIEGDEYDVAILGSEEADLQVLPLTRYRFGELPSNYWHIFSYDAKWDMDSVYKKGIKVQRPPKNVSKKLTALITEIALDTYNILDCHDYGKVEVRVDKNSNPYVLELNPNTSIRRGDCLPSVAELIGKNYGDLLEEIIALAINRYKNRPVYFHLQNNAL